MNLPSAEIAQRAVKFKQYTNTLSEGVTNDNNKGTNIAVIDIYLSCTDNRCACTDNRNISTRMMK